MTTSTQTHLPKKAAKQHGYTVLCLLVVHYKLYPIKLAWASVKGYVAKHDVKFNLTEVRLTPEGFQHTMVDMWSKFCRHVVDIENDYFDEDGLVDDMVDEINVEYDGDVMEDEDEDDLLDEDDRYLIDMALNYHNKMKLTRQNQLQLQTLNTTWQTWTPASLRVWTPTSLTWSYLCMPSTPSNYLHIVHLNDIQKIF